MASQTASSSSGTPVASTTPNPNIVLFARGVIAILTSWPVLRIAVSEKWGGPESAQKRTWMASELVDLFEPCLVPSSGVATPDQDTVEDLLLQAMVDEFECEVDDDSSPVISRKIVEFWKAVVAGEGQAKVEALEALATKSKGSTVQVQRGSAEDDDDDDDDDESDDAMDEDGEEEAPALIPSSRAQQQPEVDNDGFTVVKAKSRR